MQIWNEITQTDVTKKIIKYYNDSNLQDRTITRLLEFTIFHLLGVDNSSTYIHYFYEKFKNRILENFANGEHIIKSEDEILEFKSREYFVGKDNEIAEKIGNDLTKKLKKHPLKIYLIGVEDDGKIDPILTKRLDSDRVENIKQKIKNASSAETVHLLPVRYDENSSIIILLGGI